MATVRKRIMTYNGVDQSKLDDDRSTWVVTYTDISGKRVQKTFKRKRNADRYRTAVEAEIDKYRAKIETETVDRYLAAAEAAINRYRTKIETSAVKRLTSAQPATAYIPRSKITDSFILGDNNYTITHRYGGGKATHCTGHYLTPRGVLILITEMQCMKVLAERRKLKELH